MAMRSVAIIAAAFVGLARSGGLGDIEHVILLMQENRAFDHYFGTMAGVRGFNDPNVHKNGDQPVWNQISPLGPDKVMTPWYLNYQGESSAMLSQCLNTVSPNWGPNRRSYNYGANNRWALEQDATSIGYFKEKDLPTQWALAKNWVVADMYQASILSNTNPNRVFWATGTASVPGSPQGPETGGFPYLDNWETPGCKFGNRYCYPLKWKTAVEYYQDAGIDWMVFQDPRDNFDDSPWAWFEQFGKTGPLKNRATVGKPIFDDFFNGLRDGKLPEISFLVPGQDLSEHSGAGLPNDGGWLQDKIVRALLSSPLYNKTALIISYDEAGGWFDHVEPFVSPRGTPGEWLEDPLEDTGYTFAGPGLRVPMYIISPWTRKGGVYTEHSDHNSQIMFIEKWQAAKGRNVTTNQMVHWRRKNMGDLVHAFDFNKPDYSIPNLPTPPPRKGYKSTCANGNGPLPPFDAKEATNMASVVERGWKPVRGKLTEGRHLVMVMEGNALARSLHKRDTGVISTRATEHHDNPLHHWVVRAKEIGGNDFTVMAARDGRHICHQGELCSDHSTAAEFTVGFKPGFGHTIWSRADEKYMKIDDDGQIMHSENATHWKIYSVNY